MRLRWMGLLLVLCAGCEPPPPKVADDPSDMNSADMQRADMQRADMAVPDMRPDMPDAALGCEPASCDGTCVGAQCVELRGRVVWTGGPPSVGGQGVLEGRGAASVQVEVEREGIEFTGGVR